MNTNESDAMRIAGLKETSIPDISRVRGVHLQGIQGRSHSCLLQLLFPHPSKKKDNKSIG